MNDKILSKAKSGQLTATADLDRLTEALFNGLDVNPTTRADYEARTPLFLTYIRNNGLNRNTYLEYKRYLGSRADFSVSTKAKYLTVAKIFLKELHRQGCLPADITSTVKGFKQNKKHKKDGLNEEEMASLMEAVKKLPKSTETKRIKAILTLLTLQGLRQVEITRLDVDDIDLPAKTALVLGKGGTIKR